MTIAAGAGDAIGIDAVGACGGDGGGGSMIRGEGRGGRGGEGRGGGGEGVKGGGGKGAAAAAAAAAGATNVNKRVSVPWVLPFLRQLYLEEGLRACFKGLNARLYRAGPGSGVLLVAYEGIVKMLSGE